jgi:flagellar hook-length control protein FliK
MFCSAPGLPDVKVSFKGSLQGMDLAGQPDRSARPGKDNSCSDFFCMLQAAGLDADIAEKVSENIVLTETLPEEKDLQDWILNLVEVIQDSDCPECSLKAAIEDAQSAGLLEQLVNPGDSGDQSLTEEIPFFKDMPVDKDIQADQKNQIPGTQSFSGQGEAALAEMSSGLSDSSTLEISDYSLAGLEAFLKQYSARTKGYSENQINNGLLSFDNKAIKAGANPMTEILQAFIEKYGNPADGRDVSESLRILLQTAARESQSGHEALQDATKVPDQPKTGSSFPLNPDLLKQVSEPGAGLNNTAAQASEGADLLSGIKPNQAVMQQLAEKHAGNNLKQDAETWLREMSQGQDKAFSEQISANGQKTISQQDKGLENIREMLETLVSGNTEKMENARPVIRENSPASFGVNDSGTAGSAMFQKAENAVSTVQPGGTSFDTQLKAAESQVVNQVSVRLFTGVRQGSGDMTIQINPPELGSVKVKIISDQGGLNIHLHPQNQQVAAILERNLPALHQSLADQGIDIAGLDVSVDSGGDQDTPQFKEHAADWLAGGKNIQAQSLVDENSPAGQDHQASYSNGRGLSLRV